MATLKRSDTKDMYSWWWNSHITPKNSKWLKENLTDMDTRVKQMIKLLEQDADSFARRAEMYYKKRPELMKLVEEFYRAYRALAERYDHATGVLRQAHQTMAEAFPNQVPMAFADDTPGGSAAEVDPCTPETQPAVRALSEPDEMQMDTMGHSSHAIKRNGAFAEESDSSIIRKGLKQFDDLFGSEEAINHVKFAEGREREDLKFNDIEEKERLALKNGGPNLRARVASDSERVLKAEMEILTLKNTLARLEAEKEAGLLEYQQSLERLSTLEREVSRAQEDSRGLNERASKAEGEVQTLKDALAKLGSEREAALVQYQQCLEKINNLENSISHALKEAAELNEQASKAETKAQALKEDLARVEAEKEDALAQYKHSSETISNLGEKLLNAEESAIRMTERAENAESELETLKQVVIELTKDKETAAGQYHQCLEMISSLENKLACAQEETQRLNSEIDDGAAKLKGAEEKCSLLDRTNQSLHAELESLTQKTGDQNQELTEKQEELGRLWTSVQEEHLRFVEAETAFQTLQHLHSQSQEELRAMATEIQNRDQFLEDIETRNLGLEDELQKVKEENKGLNELNLSSAMSIENLQDEILSLRETIAKLEVEIELRVNQRNSLQQEIYCLKEELNEFNKKHQDMTGQLESVCLNPENFASSVNKLQEENTKLKDERKRDSDEKLALVEKLKIMEELNKKNALLENSLSDLNIELEGVQGRLKTLEESYQSLLKEKPVLVVENDTLVSQLQIVTENLKELQHESLCWKKEYEEELHKAIYSQVENFILQKCGQDLEEKNSFLLLECRKLLEANKASKELISELELGNSVNQKVIESVCDQISILRMGLYQMSRTLEIDAIHGYDDNIKQDQSVLDCVFNRLQEMQNSLLKSLDENQQLAIENSVLISQLVQLKLEAENLVTEKNSRCEILENRSNSKAMEVKELERSVRILERENEGLEVQLAAYNPAIVSLMESVSSLETRTLLHPKLPTDYNEVKYSDSVTDLHAENRQGTSEDKIASVSDGPSDLQGIHLRIKAIEKAVVEMERLAILENSNLNSKLETATRQIEEIRYGSSSRQENVRAKRHANARKGGELSHGLGNNVKMQRPTPEISEEGSDMTTKDIMLDQISESTLYGLSKRETEEVGNQMLEFWETNKHDDSADLKVGESQNMVTRPTDYKQISTVKGHKGKTPSTESLVKELVVDKEGSKRFKESDQEGSKRRILERLDSDAQKLANLQITVQDLKRKVVITERVKRGKGIEYDTVKEQLQEAEEAIMKLVDVNRKLMTRVEDGSCYPDGKSAIESDEGGSARRPRVSEQAQRGSEKIGRLQLEVQKIQFLLLQLDHGKESRGRTRVSERKTRVVLRDYLYGGARNIQKKKKKKAPFCACAEPRTKGD